MASMMAVVRGLEDSGVAVTLVENGRQYMVTTNELGRTVLAPVGSVSPQPESAGGHPCRQLLSQPRCQSRISQPQWHQHDGIEIRGGNGGQSVTVRNASPARIPDVASVETDTTFGTKVMYPRLSQNHQRMSRRDSCGLTQGGQQQRFSNIISSGAQVVDGRYASTYQANYCHVRPTNPEVVVSEFPPRRTGPTLSGKGQSNFVVGGQGSMAVENPQPSSPTPGSPVRGQVYTDMEVSPPRTLSPSPMRHSSFKSGTIEECCYATLRPSAVHHAFAHSLRKYPEQRPGDRPGDRPAEMVERLINYSHVRSLNKSPAERRKAPAGNCRSTINETELNFYRYGGGTGKTFRTAATATAAMDQHAVCRRTGLSKAVDGDGVPCLDKTAPYHTSPYVSYKEKYRKAEQVFNERMPLSDLDQIEMGLHEKHQLSNKKETSKSVYPVNSSEIKLAEITQAPTKGLDDVGVTPGQDLAKKLIAFPLSTIPSDAVPADAPGLLSPKKQTPDPPYPHQLFGAAQEPVIQNLRQRSQGEAGDRRYQRKTSLRRLGIKRSVVHTRKRWGSLVRKPAKNVTPKSSQQSETIKLYSPGQHSLTPLQSVLRIRQFGSSSTAQISCRNSVSMTVLSEKNICQPRVEIRHRQHNACLPVKEEKGIPSIGTVIRKTNHLLSVHESRQSIETRGHDCCDPVTQNRPSSPKNTAEFLKAQIMGNNGMELYENLSQMANEIIRKSADLPDRLSALKIRRSATCIKISDEIFSLDQRKVHVKNSKSQQIVKPKTVKLHEEILYLLRDVPLQPSNDPKERMIRREVLKKLFRKLRHLTHKMEMTESDEDLLRNIRNCLKSVLDCERCNRYKHWDNNKCEKYNVTQFQVANKTLPTQDDVILQTLITHWFTSIELRVITSQQRERFLKSFIKEQQTHFQNRPNNNTEYRGIIEASVIDFLRELPIITEPECRRTVLIHQLAAKLVEEIMALAKPKQKTNVPVSSRENYTHLKVFKDETQPCCTHHQLSMDSATQPIEKELRNVINTEISSFLCDKKLISDVIENVEQDVAGILIESMESLKQGEDDTVNSHLLQFLKETKCFSPRHAQQLTKNLLGSLKQSMAIAKTKNTTPIEKDTGASGHSTTTIVLHSKSRHDNNNNIMVLKKREKTKKYVARDDSAKRHHTNNDASINNPFDKPGASHNHKNITADSILGVTDDDVASNFKAYTETIIHLIENWLIFLQVHSVPLVHDEGSRAIVVHDLAHDIADRQKYLQINPSKRAKSAEETEYLRFQIYKWINKLVAVKNRAILSHAPQLMSKIQNIPVPLLSKPSEFTLRQSGKVNLFLNPRKNETKPSEVPTAVGSANNDGKIDAYEEKLENEIKGWLRELPQEVKQAAVFRVDSGVVSLLVKDIIEGVQENPDATCDTVCGVIDNKLSPWVAKVTKCTENKVIYLKDCIESLKTRIRKINIPVFVERAHDDNAEEKVKLCCEDLYDYPTSYSKVRMVLEDWSDRTTFLPSCNREGLSQQLDAIAQNLHDIILTSDLTTCEITRRVKRGISIALNTLPLPSQGRTHKDVERRLRRANVEALWSRIKQDKPQGNRKNVKLKVKPEGELTLGGVKTETCYQCSSASSHGSHPPSSQTRNLRFTEPRLNQSMPYSNNSPEDARRYTISGSAGADRYDGSVRSSELNMSTINERSVQKPRAPSPYQSQREHSNIISEQGRRNNIDSLLWSDDRSTQNREKSTMIQENPSLCGGTTDPNKRDTLRLNKTAQEPSNRIHEERRRHSIAGAGTNRPTEQNQTCTKVGCGAAENKQTLEVIDEDLQHYLKDWCHKVPIEDLEENVDITKVRQGLLNGIEKQIIKIRSDPLAIKDRFLTEDMLDGEVESLLDCLPQTPDLSRKRRMLKYELMEYVVENNQRLYDVCTSQSYRQQLKEALDKTLPKPKYTSAELEILQEILKENVIDEFIQANYAGIDLNRRMLFHSKIQLELERLMRELSQKGQNEPVNIDLLKTEVYNALYKVPAPSDQTMLEQVKECLVRQEITAWYKDLPISHAQGEEELHNHTNKNLLAKKIIEIEKQADPNDLSVEQNIKHEISKFINKFRLHPGEDLNINFMVDELTNRMKNNAALKDPNLSLPAPPCNRGETKFPDLRHYHEFADYKPLSSTLDPLRHRPESHPLSSTLDPNRQNQGGTSHPDLSGIEHHTLPDMSINMKAPINRRLPQSPQTEYQREFGRVESGPRQHWKNGLSAFKRGAYSQPQHIATPEETKKWISLQDVNDVDKENLRHMKLQERSQQSCGQQSVGQQSCGQQSVGQQSIGQQSFGQQSFSQQIEMSAVHTSDSRDQEKNLERRADCNRRTLGTSQVPGTSCADRNLKASDVLFKSVMEWCHQIPFARSYPDNEKQYLRAEIATKLISKIGDLNLDPNVLQDDFLYDGMLHSVVDHILNTVPQSAELSSVRGILKEEIIQCLQQARMLAITELRVHIYRKEINETITNLERSLIDSAAKEKIADALIEIKYEEKDKKQCKKKLIDAIGKYNGETTTKKIDTRTQKKLAEALVDLPAPTKEALTEQVEEVKLKNQISEWYKLISPLEAPYSADEMQKTNKLISLLAKELHELDKNSSTVDNYVDLIKTEISHWIKRLPVNPEQTCKVNQLIDEFANQLQTTQKSRRLSRQDNKIKSPCSSFRSVQSLPSEGGDKWFVNPVSSHNNLNNACNQTLQQSRPCQNLSPSEKTYNEPQHPSLPCDQSQVKSIGGRNASYNQHQNLSLRYPSQNASMGERSCCHSPTASTARPDPYYPQNMPLQIPQNTGPQFCYAPPNQRMGHKSMSGPYTQPQYVQPCPHAPKIPQVCYRPTQYHQKMSHDSETATDEDNLKLYCKCRADAPTQPLCQEKTQFYFTPPCQLYEDFKHPKTCRKCSRNQCNHP